MAKLTATQRRESQERIDGKVAASWGPRGWAYVATDGSVTLGFVPETGPPEKHECANEAEAIRLLDED